MEPYFYIEGEAITATHHGAGPWDATVLHGGAPTGLIMHLVEALPSNLPMRTTRLCIDLKRPVPIGPLTVRTEITREGRNIQTSAISLMANGKEVASATALKIRKDEPTLPEGIDMPAHNLRPTNANTEFHHEGFNASNDFYRSSGIPEGMDNALWVKMKRPFINDGPSSAMIRAAATGDYCNAFGIPLDFNVWTYINADLTLHFAREPKGEWIMLAANSWIGPDGRALSFGMLADETGYFGRSVQSLVIAKR